MNLIPVYERLDRHQILYELLEEREAHVNISHKKMPCWGDHFRFVESYPYEHWYFIVVDRNVVGACYLTKQNEIGIGVFKFHQGNGYGKRAVRLLMKEHGKRRYLANVNPLNEKSAKLFVDLGFRICQQTYEAGE